MRITVDGPAGAGKSTIAKYISQEMCILYIDSGAMYRAVAYKAVSNNVDIYHDVALKAMLEDTDIDFLDGKIFLDGDDISDKIRTPEISKMSSDISAIPMVREKLVDLQRKMGESKDVIMDGRDIGTNVFPNAEYKFYVTATPEERGRRRHQELTEKGVESDLSQVVDEIKQRDHNDSTRALNPLKKAEDAVLVDTTGKSIEEVVAEAIKYIQK